MRIWQGLNPKWGSGLESIQRIDIQYVKYYTGVNKILSARVLLCISISSDRSWQVGYLTPGQLLQPVQKFNILNNYPNRMLNSFQRHPQ
jgi:hypothetical protein